MVAKKPIAIDVWPALLLRRMVRRRNGLLSVGRAARRMLKASGVRRARMGAGIYSFTLALLAAKSHAGDKPHLGSGRGQCMTVSKHCRVRGVGAAHRRQHDSRAMACRRNGGFLVGRKTLGIRLLRSGRE